MDLGDPAHAAGKARRQRRSTAAGAASGSDRRPEPPTGEARAAHRLGLHRAAPGCGLSRWSWPTAAPYPADGGPGHPQTPAESLRRAAVRELGGEPILPTVLRRRIFPLQPAARPLLDDPLAPAHG